MTKLEKAGQRLQEMEKAELQRRKTIQPGLVGRTEPVVDSIDEAQDEAGASVAAGLVSAASHDLGGITDAINRFQAGSYGICCDCSADIPKNRLKAIPSATRCLKCQEQQELAGRSTRTRSYASESIA